MVGVILTIVLTLVCVFDIQQNKSTAIFGKDSTTALKGFAAVLILFHHIGMNTGGGILNRMNYPAVAIFFLVAGYCTMHGYYSKPQYVVQILIRKIPTMLAWCILSVVLTYTFYLIIGEPVTTNELVKCIFGNRVLNWFFASLMIKYLLFAMCSCFFKSQRSLLIGLFSVTCVYMIACRGVGLGGSWYCSSLAFPIGASVAVLVEDKRFSEKIIKSKRGGLLCVILFCLSFAGVYIETDTLITRLLHLVFQIVSAISFSCLMALLFSSVKSRGLLDWLGKNSAQMIFAQSICLILFRSPVINIENDILYALLSIVLTVLYMILLSPVYGYIGSSISKVRNRK